MTLKELWHLMKCNMRLSFMAALRQAMCMGIAAWLMVAYDCFGSSPGQQSAQFW
jgi:hypothetical protein